MNGTIQELVHSNMIIPVAAILIGGMVAIVAIISTSVRAIAVGRAKEQTKREMAAYVAEGSIDADKAVAMINAGRPRWETQDGRNKSSCCG